MARKRIVHPKFHCFPTWLQSHFLIHVTILEISGERKSRWPRAHSYENREATVGILEKNKPKTLCHRFKINCTASSSKHLSDVTLAVWRCYVFRLLFLYVGALGHNRLQLGGILSVRETPECYMG